MVFNMSTNLHNIKDGVSKNSECKMNQWSPSVPQNRHGNITAFI